MNSIIEITRSIRNARAEYKVESAKWIAAQIYADDLTPAIAPYSQVIQTLARARPVTFHDRRQEHPRGENTLVLVLQEAEVAIPMESMVNLEAERQRLQAEIDQIQSAVAQLEPRLKNKAFLSKAPAVVVDKEQTKLATRKAKLERLKEQLKKID